MGFLRKIIVFFFGKEEDDNFFEEELVELPPHREDKVLLLPSHNLIRPFPLEKKRKIKIYVNPIILLHYCGCSYFSLIYKHIETLQNKYIEMYEDDFTCEDEKLLKELLLVNRMVFTYSIVNQERFSNPEIVRILEMLAFNIKQVEDRLWYKYNRF